MLETSTNPLGKTTTYTYNQRGQVLTVTGTASYPLTYTYTGDGELETLTTSNEQGNGVTKWEYHSGRVGLLVKKIHDHGGASPESEDYEHDPFGKVTRVDRAAGEVYDLNYTIDEFGDVEVASEGYSADPYYSENTFVRNSYGQVNKVVQKVKHPRFGSSTRTITYFNTHHPNGALASEKRDSQASFSMLAGLNSHLPFSSRIRYTQDPLNERRNQSYETDLLRPTGANSLEWETLGGTKHTFDTKGRLETVASNVSGTLAQNAPNLTHTYGYHPNSAIPSSVTANDSAKDVFKSTYVVNRLNQTNDVISHSLKAGNTLGLRSAVGYHYNELGQRTRATRENGFYWKYDYNDRGEVTSAKKHQVEANQVLGGLQFEYDYDNIGNRTEMRFGGDPSGGNLRAVSYNSTGDNQYSLITHPGYHHVTGMAGLTGQPPAAGSIKINNSQITSNELQGSYFSKELQQTNTNSSSLVPITIEESPNDGSATTTDQLGDIFIPRENVAPQYVNGNLVNDGRWIYKWNASNRLVRMEPIGGANATRPILDFLYDWKGRRISKKVTYGTASNSPSTITSFIYNDWNIVASVSIESGSFELQIVRCDWGLDLSRSFQGAGGVGGLLGTRSSEAIATVGFGTLSYSSTTEAERHFPSYDGNGNIIAWTTDSGGTTTTRDFDAFGNIVTNQGTRWSASTAFGFSTKYEDVETGLLYYGYRHYDPVTGRWPSRDPIGERGGINLYGFGPNSPTNGWDYLGQDWQGFKDWWSEGTEANIDWLVEGTKANAERVEEVFDDVVETVSDASKFIGVEVNAGLGIGYTYVSCCDEKDAKRKFHYMKYCVGPAVGVALSAGGVTGLNGEDCRSGNYAGIFLEININVHPFVGGAIDLGFGLDLLSGVNDIGASIGLGAGVTVCNYVLIDEEIEHCACEGGGSEY